MMSFLSILLGVTLLVAVIAVYGAVTFIVANKLADKFGELVAIPVFLISAILAITTVMYYGQ